MNFKLVFQVTGKTLLVEAAAMLLPMLVGLFYGESPRSFLLAILITAAAGVLLSSLCANKKFFPREGFFAAGLIWVLFGVFGALPFYFSGCFSSYIDCLFECISGFTTTGSTVLAAVEHLPKSILFWRSFTQWLGGMGVLVLTIALMPSLGNRSVFLLQAESPGPVKSKLVPKTAQSSKILYCIYLVLTFLMIACLCVAGLPLFDSVTTAMSTAATGGFSVKNLSIAAYNSPVIEILVTVFTLLFSVNFSLYFLILCGKWKRALKSDELRFFLLVVVGAAAIIAFNIYSLCQNDLGRAIRYAVFQVVAIISSTGFSCTDYNLWPQLSHAVIIILMFVGACAGSTGGGMKCSRVLLMLKSLRREVHQAIHPRSVHVVKLDDHVVDEPVLQKAHVYFATYLILLVCGVLLISLDNFSFTTNFTAILSSLSNIGPGLDQIGPLSNFAPFSAFSKLVLSLLMVIGRLEIFPILILFSRSAWKRS